MTADRLPRLGVGTFEARGIVFLRAGDLVRWLAEAIDETDPDDARRRDALADVQAVLAEAGGIRPRG